MATRGRPEVNADVDDFFDVPVRSPHKTTTFTMSTKSNADDRNSAGDFQPPCASGRKDCAERPPDTDRGEILTLTMSSDSGSDVETRVNKNSARSSNRSQRSARTTPVSGNRARKGKRASSNDSRGSDTDSESDDGSDTDSDSYSHSGSSDTGTSVPSPRKSSEIKSETRFRDTRSMGDGTNSHKQAWNGNGCDASQNAIERPKTAHRRRVNGQEGNGRLQSRVRDSRNRSRSNDSRGRSRSHSSRSSSSCSSLTSSDSNASDVTDVSPLNSPTHKVSSADMHRWERCQLGGRPPRSPANKGGSSQRSHPDSTTSTPGNGHGNLNLLQATSDKMDLKILMQAVLEMEREKDEASSTDQRVFFQPGGLKDTKHLDSRQNFSFTNDKVRDIDTENQRLMHQILKYTAKKKVDQRSETSQAAGDGLVVTTKKRQTSAAVTHLTPSAINRMREQRRIERENQVCVFLRILSLPTSGYNLVIRRVRLSTQLYKSYLLPFIP